MDFIIILYILGLFFTKSLDHFISQSVHLSSLYSMNKFPIIVFSILLALFVKNPRYSCFFYVIAFGQFYLFINFVSSKPESNMVP